MTFDELFRAAAAAAQSRAQAQAQEAEFRRRHADAYVFGFGGRRQGKSWATPPGARVPGAIDFQKGPDGVWRIPS